MGDDNLVTNDGLRGSGLYILLYLIIIGIALQLAAVLVGSPLLSF